MEEKYRYYLCELKWNAWECCRTETPHEIKDHAPSTLVTQLIPVVKWMPKFVDPLVLSYKTKKPILMKTR